MSEDRHTFSEARPVPGLDLPTWDVDVFRDGVPEPILTLRVDNNNLPPRKSKKKKVAWKLPDTIDQIPRFGVDEKRRLLELFKTIKKERRKSMQKRQADGSETNSNDGSYTEDNNNENQQQGKNEQNGTDSNAAAQQSEPSTYGMEHLSIGQGGPSQGGDSSSNSNNPPPPGLTASHPPPGLMSRTQSMPVPPGMSSSEKDSNAATSQPNSKNNHDLRAPPGMERSQSMPVEAEAPPPPPPPGLSSMNNQQHHQQHQQQYAQASGVSKIEPLLPPGAPSPLQVPPFVPPSRYFAFPPTIPEQVFAQQVANTYITLLQSGQVDELLLYYSLTAQKSLSLKSAHSMCSTPHDIKTQLQSLVSCAFVVHGITVQRGMNWILLVWSGMCQVSGKPHGFTHTLILVPIPGEPAGRGAGEGLGGGLPAATSATEDPPKYQIQNDALVLLAAEE